MDVILQNARIADTSGVHPVAIGIDQGRIVAIEPHLNVMRGVTPAHKLLHAGVNCSLSTNNVLHAGASPLSTTYPGQVLAWLGDSSGGLVDFALRRVGATVGELLWGAWHAADPRPGVPRWRYPVRTKLRYGRVVCPRSATVVRISTCSVATRR